MSPSRSLRPALMLAFVMLTQVPLRVTQGQTTKPSYPSLPGAVDAIPAWLASDRGIPFDAKAYFALPPANQNAAPLYLDALFEFSGDVASCFAPGAETLARSKAVANRTQRLRPLQEAFSRDPSKVDHTAIRSVLRDYEEGFRKLKRAQARPRCVFSSGVSMDTMLPHAQAMRSVVSVAAIAALPDLDQGRLDAVIASANSLLRMARDLQARGQVISQLVSVAIDTQVIEFMIKPVLHHPKVSTAQCDKILALLADHQKQWIDAEAESLKVAYIMARFLLHDLADPRTKAKTIETFLQATNVPADQRGATQKSLAEATRQQMTRTIAMANQVYRDLLSAAKLPYTLRQSRISAIVKALPQSSGPDRVALSPLNSLALVDDALTRHEATLHAMQILATIRRWQVAHKSWPTSLAAACSEAKLTPIPTDPYTSSDPLRFVLIDAAPVVYSVGKDGRDDGGRTDNVFNTKPGDLTFRLTPRERNR